MVPKKIKRTSPSELSIEWDDGHSGRHTVQSLRMYCPCASCKSEDEAPRGFVRLDVLTPGKYELRSIQLVGSYAVQLTWTDGHSTGIYTFEYLREICECDECYRTSGKKTMEMKPN